MRGMLFAYILLSTLDLLWESEAAGSLLPWSGRGKTWMAAEPLGLQLLIAATEEHVAVEDVPRMATPEMQNSASEGTPTFDDAAPAMRSTETHGITWSKAKKKWTSRIRAGGKRHHHLGSSSDEEYAGMARDRAAVVHDEDAKKLDFQSRHATTRTLL